jgi:ABC-type transporter Mla subunit MlaD
LHKEEGKATEEKNNALTDKNLTIKVLNEYLQAKDDLLSFGQNIEDIPKLCNMLKNCADQRYNFNEFVKNIQETKTLTERVEKLQDTMSDFEKKKAELEEKIDNLNTTKTKTEESIKTISDVALPQIKSTSQEVNQLLAKLKKDMETGIEEVNKNAEDSISKLQTSAQESLTNLQDILDKVNPAIDRLSKAEEFGEQIGKLETLNPLFKLCEEARGTKYEVFPVIRILLEKFKIWLSRYPELSDLKERTTTLITSIDGELAIK